MPFSLLLIVFNDIESEFIETSMNGIDVDNVKYSNAIVICSNNASDLQDRVRFVI